MRGSAFVGGLLIAALGLSRTRATEPERALAAAAGTQVETAIPTERTNANATEPEPVAASRATRYVALSDERCLAALDERGVPYARISIEDRPDVDTPVRI